MDMHPFKMVVDLKNNVFLSLKYKNPHLCLMKV